MCYRCLNGGGQIKKLTFKTTPMSIFYQEPPPPEEDISNKSQSPKLGHRKSLLPAVSEVNRNINGQSTRLSLDEKVPQTLLEGLLLCIQRKPQRKSLPGLLNFCCGELLVLFEKCLVCTVFCTLWQPGSTGRECIFYHLYFLVHAPFSFFAN